MLAEVRGLAGLEPQGSSGRTGWSAFLAAPQDSKALSVFVTVSESLTLPRPQCARLFRAPSPFILLPKPRDGHRLLCLADEEIEAPRGRTSSPNSEGLMESNQPCIGTLCEPGSSIEESVLLSIAQQGALLMLYPRTDEQTKTQVGEGTCKHRANM